mmetsp:Transcript_34523/g.106734  ORF Transcript_34523/g.106734 Transcript_34523/m.106734 type:complete len:220 (-) Transcript_34523:38-697(-)
MSLEFSAVPARISKRRRRSEGGMSTATSASRFEINPTALRTPLAIVCGCRPSSTNGFTCLSISPASKTTDVVPSPTSESCAAAAIDTICAAGCTTSSSRAIVPQSDETSVFPRWLMMSFFMPLGPSDVWTMVANCFVAPMFLRMHSSTPSASVDPPFIMPWAPPAMFMFIAMMPPPPAALFETRRLFFARAERPARSCCGECRRDEVAAACTQRARGCD